MISGTVFFWCLLWQCNYTSLHALISNEISSDINGFTQNHKCDHKNSRCEVASASTGAVNVWDCKLKFVLVSARRQRKAWIILLLSSTSSVLGGEKHKEWDSQTVRGILFCFRCIKFTLLYSLISWIKISLLAVPSLCFSAVGFSFLVHAHIHRLSLEKSSSSSSTSTAELTVTGSITHMKASLFRFVYCRLPCG